MRKHSETKVLASFDVVLTHTSPSLNTVTVPDSLLCVSFARMRIATVLPLPRCFLAYLSGVNLREYCLQYNRRMGVGTKIATLRHCAARVSRFWRPFPAAPWT